MKTYLPGEKAKHNTRGGRICLSGDSSMRALTTVPPAPPPAGHHHHHQPPVGASVSRSAPTARRHSPACHASWLYAGVRMLLRAWTWGCHQDSAAGAAGQKFVRVKRAAGRQTRIIIKSKHDVTSLFAQLINRLGQRVADPAFGLRAQD